MSDYFGDLESRLREFADARDWGGFHSPKNLSMALIVEAAELVEHFQWLTEEQSASLAADKRREIGHELADILIYLVRIADRMDIDLPQAVDEKIRINESRYPADQVRGQSKKYSDY
ncbi:MAG: MazG nucleotide pyrophosphohydrolase [Gammaproteobacteria bacterium]|nr:MAG: MazG nucleotide pyrophosphohydrolase [Gammaproteobacteria bacterium]TND02266.1 MAG: MazG nucleotide pyrophosphohydrolase [Gammaproteobacteria bacterium]